MASLHVGNPRVDIVITVNGRNAVVFETKSGGLGPLQSDPWPLHKVQLAISTVGANVTSQKELLKGSLAAFFNCMSTWFCKISFNH
jgi:hypothetical protein